MRIAELLTISLFANVLSTVALAGTISLPAYVDGTIQFSGAFGLEAFDSQPIVRTNSAGPNNNRSAVFEFDLAEVPSHATIMSATLQLTLAETIANATSSEAPLVFQGYPGNGQIQVDDFGTAEERISTLTVVANETLPAVPLSPLPGTMLSFSFTNLEPLQDAVGNSRFFGIRTLTEDFASFQVHSRENGNGARNPTLQIEFVPEPPANVMLLAGLLALYVSRRSVR